MSNTWNWWKWKIALKIRCNQRGTAERERERDEELVMGILTWNFCVCGCVWVVYFSTQTYVIHGEWTKCENPFSQFITTGTSDSFIGWLACWYSGWILLISTFHSISLSLSSLHLSLFLSIFRLILISLHTKANLIVSFILYQLPPNAIHEKKIHANERWWFNSIYNGRVNKIGIFGGYIYLRVACVQ